MRIATLFPVIRLQGETILAWRLRSMKPLYGPSGAQNWLDGFSGILPPCGTKNALTASFNDG
jgi:hypothetical protein